VPFADTFLNAQRSFPATALHWRFSALKMSQIQRGHFERFKSVDPSHCEGIHWKLETFEFPYGREEMPESAHSGALPSEIHIGEITSAIAFLMICILFTKQN
jgi:hypothetical protein